MTTQERLSRILVQRYKLEPARLTADQPLDALGIDSLGMAEMLFFIEEEFGVQLPSEGITLGTLAEATKYIDELVVSQQKESPRTTAEQSPAAPRSAASDSSR